MEGLFRPRVAVGFALTVSGLFSGFVEPGDFNCHNILSLGFRSGKSLNLWKFRGDSESSQMPLRNIYCSLHQPAARCIERVVSSCQGSCLPISFFWCF